MRAKELILRMRELRQMPFWLQLGSGQQLSSPAIIEMQSESMTILAPSGGEETIFYRDIDIVSPTRFEAFCSEVDCLDPLIAVSESDAGVVVPLDGIVRCEICGERVPFGEYVDAHLAICRDRNEEYQFPKERRCPMCGARTWWHQGGDSWCKSCLYGMSRFSSHRSRRLRRRATGATTGETRQNEAES